MRFAPAASKQFVFNTTPLLVEVVGRIAAVVVGVGRIAAVVVGLATLFLTTEEIMFGLTVAIVIAPTEEAVDETAIDLDLSQGLNLDLDLNLNPTILITPEAIPTRKTVTLVALITAPSLTKVPVLAPSNSHACA